MKDSLYKLYDFGTIKKISRATGGHDGKNQIIESTKGKFFLKQYKEVSDQRVKEIHSIYEYFRSYSIPVISPLKLLLNKDYFSYKGHFYALFPFIKAKEITLQELNEVNLKSMGKLLAEMHKIVEQNPPKIISFKKDRTFDIDYFNKSAVNLLNHIDSIENKTQLDEMNIETLKNKIEYINNNKNDILSLNNPSEIILCHRDFHERNLFFDDDGEVYKIFDFDKAGNDAKYLEISRTILFVCTPGEFEHKNFKRVAHLLNGYLSVSPIDKDKLQNDLKYYIYDNMFSKWIFEQYYIKGNKRTKDFMHPQHDTQLYMSKNLDKFLDRVITYL